MRTEQEVLAYLYRKRDGALSGATRVVYAEAISAIEGDLLGDPHEASTPRRFDDRAVLCDRDAPVADHRRRPGGSDLRVAVRDRRHLAAERRPSADPLEGVQVSGPVAELLLKGAATSRSPKSKPSNAHSKSAAAYASVAAPLRRQAGRVKHALGYRIYKRQEKLLPHPATAEWQFRGKWYCVCAYAVITTDASPATRHRQQPAPGNAVRTD
jgi:hypothetical protein